MAESAIVRVFISSPADVRPERLMAERVVARLAREFLYHFRVEPVMWERAPLVATHHFQDERNIPRARHADIVVVILWSRLGMPLPDADYRGAISGRPVTGTEYEFEDAYAGNQENGIPDLLLYRKTARITVELDDEEALEDRRRQRALVQDFIGRWFRAENRQGFTAASHTFETVTEFEEKLYDHLRELLERRAGARVEGVEVRWPDAPYRALLSYEYEQSAVFFGRGRARNELRELLVRQIQRGIAFALVFGASGSGKSSLVKAGLLPDLALPGMIARVGLLRRAAMRPSDKNGDPLATLAEAILSPTALPELTELRYTGDQLATLLREAPGQAALPIRQGLTIAGKAASLTELAEARLVVVIDQLEELFTLDRLGDGERAAFVVALDTLARSGLVWVVATMRSDFFDRLETLPALAALSAGEARFLLLPPDAAEIGQIIRQPALEAGLHFEYDSARGLSLDEVIRQAVAPDRGALPLLSFLLDQLWRRRTETGLLTFAAYDGLGGLAGAIGGRAEQVFLSQPERVQRELVRLLRELVTTEGGIPMSRSAPLSRFPAGSPGRALVDALLDPGARLLVADGDDHEARLRLAHEGLVSHWLRARDVAAAEARDLELRSRLEQEAERWRSASRHDKPLRVATGLLLTEARGLAARWGGDLPDEIIAFVAASRRTARWRRVRLAAMVGAAATTLPVIAGLAWAGAVWWGVRALEAEWAAKDEFVRVPAGCFQMGSPDTEAGRNPNEGPMHQVCVNSFELARFEVTQAAWRQVMVGVLGLPSSPEPSYYKGDDRLPVEQVNWHEAQFFVGLMSLFGHGHYRLPREAEWEYAARAGTTTSRYWGENINEGCASENIADLNLRRRAPDLAPGFANCDDGRPGTAPVGSYKPNPLGLYDMLGNVAEWLEDCASNYRETPIDGSANTEGPCASRVIRGGSWLAHPRLVRAANRNSLYPSNRRYNLGFRVARTITP